MKYTPEKLRLIYDRTDGRCHICRKTLSFVNYGNQGSKGAWEVEHSKARARGGTDHGNNLYASCIYCNRSKGVTSTRTVRQRSGITKAPLSKAKRQDKWEERKLFSAVGFGLAGLRMAGPVGGLIGLGIGYIAAENAKPTD
jgi:5-methylcytosine-specific restriction endonuclease McrA